jgi:ABC-type nitrate/sulfonate/bicarbonate transport system permease component
VTVRLVERVGRPALGWVVFAAAVGIWEAVARSEGSFLVPTASAVAERAWQVWPTPEFLGNVEASLRRLAAGYAIGASVGVAIGVSMGSSRRVRQALEPLVELLRATPAIALVPALIVILGVGDRMRIAVIAFGVVFPVLVNSMDGVRAVSPELHETASLLRMGRADRILHVDLPAALPSIFAGLRIAVSIGLVMVVVSEFVGGGGGGLGHYIRVQQTQFNIPEVYAGILFLGLLGFVLNGVFVRVERRALSWHYETTGNGER